MTKSYLVALAFFVCLLVGFECVTIFLSLVQVVYAGVRLFERSGAGLLTAVRFGSVRCEHFIVFCCLFWVLLVIAVCSIYLFILFLIHVLTLWYSLSVIFQMVTRGKFAS